MPPARTLTATPEAYRGAGCGQPFGATERTDAWWQSPLFQLVALLVAMGYAGWSGSHPDGVQFESLRSPIHAELPGIAMTGLLTALTLAVPILFRATCYYMRRVYYRSVFGSPAACAVGTAPHLAGYGGEKSFPFWLQNLHRYFLYLALALIAIHWFHVVRSFWYDGHVRVGLGNLLLILDTALLTLYATSCHAFRHMIGGNVDCFSCAKGGEVRYKAWSLVSALNGRHMQYFWASLYTVVIADAYIRMCAAGILNFPGR